MANGYFSVRIATKPYLKKFLQAEYGNPLVFTTNNSFGNIIDAILVRPSEDHHNKEELKQRFDKYTTTVEISLPRRNLVKRKGFVITDRHIFALNKFIERLFCEKLYSWSEMGVVYSVEFKKNLEDFCWKYKIEVDEDITFDALQKKEYRFRKKKEEESKETAPPIVQSKIEYFSK